MKFTIKRSNILEVLSKIQGLTGRKSNLAVTSNVLIKAENTGITILATDLETGFEGSYPADVESEGQIAINARKFYEIVRDFPDKDILINEVENYWIKIGNEKVEYHIVGVNPDDFPENPQINDLFFFRIDSSALNKMIEKALIISSTDDKRAHIIGVYLEKIEKNNENIVRMVSTDTGRLITVDYSYPKEVEIPDWFGVIIPKTGLNEVGKFLSSEGSVQLGLKDNYFIIKKETETIIIRLLEGKFPKYDNILKKDNGHVIIMEKQKFSDMLKRMSILYSEDYKGVIFNFKDNKLKIKSNNPDIGESKEDMDIKFTGEPIIVAFNPKFFIEILNVVDDEKVIINITDKEKPCLIEGEKDKSFINVIMPMRI